MHRSGMKTQTLAVWHWPNCVIEASMKYESVTELVVVGAGRHGDHGNLHRAQRREEQRLEAGLTLRPPECSCHPLLIARVVW